MNIQQHERIIRIKKLSRYLYLTLSGIHYLLLVLWPAALLWILIGTQGSITLINETLTPENMSFLQSILVGVIISAFFFLMLKVTFHFRQLIQHFANGDIFNKKATVHARRALLYALVIYGMFACTSIVMWILMYIETQSFQLALRGNYIFAMIIFGLMYVLLWALEIGCDLNEESELTI
jgi:hypothetical protein